jgi:hypothetical protein
MHGRPARDGLGYFPPGDCSLQALGSTKDAELASAAGRRVHGDVAVCSADVSLRTMRWRNTVPESLEVHDLAIKSEFGTAFTPWYRYDILFRTHNYHFTLVSSVPKHVLDWRPSMAPFVTDLLGWGAGETCEMQGNEHFVVATPTFTDPNRYQVETNELEYKRPWGALGALPDGSARHGLWQYEPAAFDSASKNLTAPGELAFVVGARALDGTRFSDGTFERPACNEQCDEGQRCVSTKLTRHECAGTVGCFAAEDACLGDMRSGGEPQPDTGKVASWCEAGSDWWVVPGASEDVTIPAGATVTLDGCTTALVGRVDVYGTLRFKDGADSRLRAHYVHVAARTCTALPYSYRTHEDSSSHACAVRAGIGPWPCAVGRVQMGTAGRTKRM